MMDDLTANKSHIPCQSWVGQNGWSVASTQGPPLNPLSSSQHLSLGSSNQRSSYNHLQVSNQSCMRDLSTLSTRGNPHQPDLYKAPQAGSNPSSGTLFASTTIPSVSQMNPFAQEIPHTSPTLLSVNQGKNIPSLSLAERNQVQQHLSLLPPQDPFKVSFQPQTNSQGLPNGLQNLPISLPSCGQREQCQWTPPSLGRGVVNRSVPGAAAHPNRAQLQEGNNNPAFNNESQRLTLLNQRAQLLQQLAELDKTLESMPPEDSSDGQSPHAASQPPPAMEESSQCEQTKTSNAQQDQRLTAKSEKKEHVSAESEDEGNPDDPASDDDFSAFIPDPAGFSSDDSGHSRPSTPVEEKPVLKEEEPNKLGSSLFKDMDVGTPVKSSAFSWKKSSKVAVAAIQNPKEKKVYRKKNYCPFCTKSVSKMARHFEAIHSDQPEVAVAFQYPKLSKERQKIWNRLVNQGNFAHNKTVLKTGKGQLTAKKRPVLTGQAQDFLHCLYCRGLFAKKCLRRHVRSCSERVKNEDESEVGRRRYASLCAMEASEDLGITEGLKSILSVMTYDEVTRAVMDDPIILQLGELFFKQHGSDERRHEYIRQNLRQVARLVLEAQKTSPLKKLEDFFVPSNFPCIVASVKVLAGYDPESKTYKAPSLAVKLGYSIQKACAIVEGNAAKHGDERVAESAREFLTVYQEKWTELISSGALKMLRKKKLQRDQRVPSARDVKLLHAHLEKVHDVAEKKLRTSPSTENYSTLTKIMLARTILFNRRCAREVSFVELKDFMSRKKSSLQSGMDVSVSDLERLMCGYFTRIDIRGKCGRTVPIFLKPSFVSALELIVEVREACGVPKKNPYLFGRPHGLSAQHGTDCIQRYAKACGAEDPEALRSKTIRKHYAEMLQIMNMDENEAREILGPDGHERTLQQDTDMHVDVQMQSNERSHQAASWHQNECSSGPSTATHQPAHGEVRGNNQKPKRSVHSDKKGSKSKCIHRTWEEAEVQAVERHLMRFIKKHKVPQKDDCVECLEAEPEALSTRSWKGVKDYVRNRITALKRTSKT
ncbi:uncharacterized protein LOC117818719 isoform X2 [Xyrichtys novacula]|uniref:Uncharacterized protein LOC117818719 isoform X2 n=1 Tax=Xyrichtys novacula TaxID=13765 RepID=A0AAV1G7W5_XYRNO|nr:uncharacterized protein LOC117818719 isoform X2 [Xyrichtys novacula]